MRDQLGHLVLGDPNVVVEDQAAASSGRQEVLVPAHHADAALVAVHAPQLGAFLHVPDLNLAGTEADADVGSVAAPPDARHVRVGGRLEQAVHGPRLGRPDIDVSLEPDGDLVPGTPVEQIEVVVVDQAGRVQDPFGGSQDSSPELSRRVCGLQWPVVLRAEVDGLGRLGRGRLERQDACVERHSTRRSQRGLIGQRIGRGPSIRAADVLVVVIVVEAEPLQSGSGIVFGRTSTDFEGACSVGQNRRPVVARGPWPLQVRVELCPSGGGKGFAGGSVRDVTVGRIVC